MAHRLDTCGVRFDTVACEGNGCDMHFDVDSNHPLWPDGPFLCHKHEPQRSQLPRKLEPGCTRRSEQAQHAPLAPVR